MEFKKSTVEELIEQDVIEKPMDGNHGSIHPKTKDFTDVGIPFITAADIHSDKVDIEKANKLSEKDAHKLKKGFAKKRDVLLTHKASVGRTAIVNNMEYDYIILSPQVTYYRIKDTTTLLPEYLYLYFKSNYFNQIINQWAGGSTRKYIGITAQKKLPILYPSIKNQKKIVDFIMTFEYKVQVNKKIIANLEELSQTLFKHWFVDFEFPDKNGNPYKSSGGEMIDSELGKIPDSWKIYKLKNIATHKKETFNPKKSEEVTVKHFSLPAYDNEEQAIEEEVNKIKSNKWIINNNCVLFSKMNPDTKRIWLPVIDNKKLNVASSEFVVMESPNNKINSFIYNICLNSQFIDYLKANTTGSTNSRQRVKPTIAVNYKLAIEDSIVKKYSEIITPYMEEMKILRSEIGKLTQLRDTLLPKLMSGELEISDDIEVNMDELSI
ncbi:restriction endonuclease subunit S [Staphylococcus hominis]|uniref:restriction endonuclease subunit S n=1 Tax=Staphylococcus hominis TaxID=1290 RepID=UPI0021B39826|nr:restriction endonuclease subunit S [Staphylococcus hominis]